MENKNVNRHIIVIVAMMILFAFSLQFSSAASDIKIINNTTDGGITEALNSVDSTDSGEIIHLTPGVYSGENNTNILVDKNVTFKGRGDKTVIDGKSRGNLFIIGENVNVTFINIVFLNAASQYGAAVYNNFSSSHVTFINCIFKDNTAMFGAAIYNEGNVVVKNSIFIDNLAIYNGGAIYNNGDFTIINSNFTSNVANFGGAIFNNGTMNARNCNFITNNAIYDTLSLSQVRENQRPRDIYGGSEEDSENMRLSSGFRINRAGDDAAGDAIREKLSKISFGGAIYNSGTFTLNDSNLTYNIANCGGAIFNNGTMTVSNCNLTYNHAEFNTIRDTDMAKEMMDESRDNSLSNSEGDDDQDHGINEVSDENSYGGAIYNSGTFILIDSNISYNSANYGGAIYNSGTMTVSNCDLDYNQGTIILYQATQAMLAQENIACECIQCSENICVNRADDDAAGLIVNERLNMISFGGAIYNIGIFTLIDSNLTGNTANYGGAIYNSGNMDIYNCNFAENNAHNNVLSQAVLQLLGGEDVSENMRINRADDDAAGLAISERLRKSISEDSFGGAIYNHKEGNIVVFNSRFDYNIAENGGAIYNEGTFVLTGSNFTNNTAYSYGGAIFNSGNMTVSGNRMTGNLAGVERSENLADSETRIRDVDMAEKLDGDKNDDDSNILIKNPIHGLSDRNCEGNETYGHEIYNIGNMGNLVLTYLGNSTKYVEPSQNITLYAHLTDDMGNSVTGQNISFLANGKTIGSAMSVAGYASISYIVPNSLDVILVNGDYDGHVNYPIDILNGQLRFKEEDNLIIPDKGTVENGNDSTYSKKSGNVKGSSNNEGLNKVANNTNNTSNNERTSRIANDAGNTSGNDGNSNSIAKASMKETGMPLIAIFLVFIILIGTTVRKNQK